MLKKQIQIGKTYYAKVSGRIVHVQITGESRYGGWDGVNRGSGRVVHIKSAARLRAEVKPKSPIATVQEQFPGGIINADEKEALRRDNEALNRFARQFIPGKES